MISEWSAEQLNNLEHENELITTLKTIERLDQELPVLSERIKGLKARL